MVRVGVRKLGIQLGTALDAIEQRCTARAAA